MLNNQFVKISILTATYNAAEHLPRLMESLRAQIDQDFEWIVMDGGSKDNTVALLRDAGDIVSHWKSEADFGIYHALNKAVTLATGTYYLVMGADDQLQPNAIQNYRKAAIASGSDVISAPVLANGVEMMPRRRMAWWSSSPPFVSSHSVGALIKTSLHEELGLYSRRFPISADTYFFLRAWKSEKTFYYFSEVVGVYGTDGLSSNDTLGGICESFRANSEVRGFFVIHMFLFILRLVKSGVRINKALAIRRQMT